MDSFEELGLTPELVEALAGEGIERPTPLQEAALPVLRQGNNLVLAAGPGSGILVAWVAPLLERLEPSGETPRLLALTSATADADRLAASTGRLAAITGHTVAALGAHWKDPERAHILFGSPSTVLAAVSSGRLSLGDVQVLVVDQAQLLEKVDALEDLEEVIAYLPTASQRVLTALPLTERVSDLVERHFKRAPTLPPAELGRAPARGRVRFRVTPEPKEDAARGLVSELLAAGARHVLVFCSSEDRAADLGDYLTLHGYLAGAPGDQDAPVWLGVDALAARGAASAVEGVVVVSYDAPTDPDSLDRRHGFGAEGVILALAREMAHVRDVGRKTGYETVPSPPPARPPDSLSELRASLERAIEQEDTDAYLAVLEPLLDRFDPARIAAAAVALLRQRPSAPSQAGPRGVPAPTASAHAAPRASAQPAWSKLFIGVGERDELRPGDLLGAITGEAGVDGRAVGKIEIRESHTLVEVHDVVAQDVIKALNGTTIRGRAVRADFDRPRGKPTRAGRDR